MNFFKVDTPIFNALSRFVDFIVCYMKENNNHSYYDVILIIVLLQKSPVKINVTIFTPQFF